MLLEISDLTGSGSESTLSVTSFGCLDDADYDPDATLPYIDTNVEYSSDAEQHAEEVIDNYSEDNCTYTKQGQK